MKPVSRTLLAISGMTCAACVSSIEKSLSSIPGVVKSAVSLASEEAQVEFDPKPYRS